MEVIGGLWRHLRGVKRFLKGKGLGRLLKCFVRMGEKDGLVALSNQMVYVYRRDLDVLCGSVYTNTDGILKGEMFLN